MRSENISLKALAVGLLLGFVMLFGRCGGQSVDYYTKFKQEGCEPSGPAMSTTCREVILKYANIDVASFDGYPGKLEQLVSGIYFLFYAPMAFPLDQKMFGLGTMEEAELFDFISEFGGLEQPNQKMLNYVLGAVSTIDYLCTDENIYASYRPWAIHFCMVPVAENAMEDSLIKSGAFSASLILHEARHRYIGYHSADCTQGAFNCDKGMDHCYGWNLAFWWGVLQGSRLYPKESGKGYPQDFIQAIALDAMNYSRKLYSLPEPMQSLQAREFRQTYRSKVATIEQLNPWMNRSKLDFLPPVEISLPLFVKTIEPIDIKSDGQLGILYADLQGLYLIKNKGNREFETTFVRPVDGCGPISSMVAGDWSGDGVTDLMTVGRVLCGFKGDGTGGFSLQQVRWLPSYATNHLQASQLNGDSALDFVMVGLGEVSSPSMLYVGLSGDAEHIWSSYPIPVPAENPATIYAPLLTDVDGDGKVDILLRVEGDKKWILFYKGDGSGKFFLPVLRTLYETEQDSCELEALAARKIKSNQKDSVGLLVIGSMYYPNTGTKYNFFETSLAEPEIMGKVNWVPSEDSLALDKTYTSSLKTWQFDGNLDDYWEFISGISTDESQKPYLRLYSSSPWVHRYHLQRVLASNKPRTGTVPDVISGDFDGDKKIDLAVLFSSNVDATATLSILWGK